MAKAKGMKKAMAPKAGAKKAAGGMYGMELPPAFLANIKGKGAKNMAGKKAVMPKMAKGKAKGKMMGGKKAK